jgi:hypothetical protein
LTPPRNYRSLFYSEYERGLRLWTCEGESRPFHPYPDDEQG